MDFIYNLLKDLFNFIRYKDEDKLIALTDPEQWGIPDQVVWCNPERLESLLQNGYAVYYKKDKIHRKRYRYVNKARQILLLKPP